METFELLTPKALKFEDFDLENFDWKKSYLLLELYSNEFNKWWDPEKFNWEFSDYLVRYAPQYFDTWWDEERFNWRFANLLPVYLPNKFDTWFIPKHLTMYNLSCIADYCGKQLRRWFKTNDCNEWLEKLHNDVNDLLSIYDEYNLDSCAYQAYREYLIYIEKKLKKRNKNFSINLFINRFLQIRGLFYTACERIIEMKDNNDDNE